MNHHTDFETISLDQLEHTTGGFDIGSILGNLGGIGGMIGQMAGGEKGAAKGQEIGGMISKFAGPLMSMFQGGGGGGQ